MSEKRACNTSEVGQTAGGSVGSSRWTHRLALGRGGVARPDVASAVGLAGEGGAAGGLEAAAAEPVSSRHAEQHSQVGHVLTEGRSDTHRKKSSSHDSFPLPAPHLRQELHLLCCSLEAASRVFKVADISLLSPLFLFPTFMQHKCPPNVPRTFSAYFPRTLINIFSTGAGAGFISPRLPGRDGRFVIAARGRVSLMFTQATGFSAASVVDGKTIMMRLKASETHNQQRRSSICCGFVL